MPVDNVTTDTAIILQNIHTDLQYISNEIYFIIVISLLIFISIMFYNFIKRFI